MPDPEPPVATLRAFTVPGSAIQADAASMGDAVSVLRPDADQKGWTRLRARSGMDLHAGDVVYVTDKGLRALRGMGARAYQVKSEAASYMGGDSAPECLGLYAHERAHQGAGGPARVLTINDAAAEQIERQARAVEEMVLPRVVPAP